MSWTNYLKYWSKLKTFQVLKTSQLHLRLIAGEITYSITTFTMLLVHFIRVFTIQYLDIESKIEMNTFFFLVGSFFFNTRYLRILPLHLHFGSKWRPIRSNRFRFPIGKKFLFFLYPASLRSCDYFSEE